MRNEHWYDSGQRHPDSGFSDHASFELYEGPWFVRVILQETDDERMDAVRRDWKVGNFDWGKWNPHEKRAGFYRVQLEDYNCLAETEDTFFFLNTETARGIECIPVPKWVFKDLGEMDAFLNFCRDKGVKWAGLDKTADLPKNDRMLYILLFMVLLAVVISGIIRAVYL